MAAVRNVSQQGRISRDNGFYNFWADKRKGCDGNPLASRTGVDHGLSQVATQFGSVENAQLPARRPGGLYKIRCHKQWRFCRGLSTPRSGRRDVGAALPDAQAERARAGSTVTNQCRAELV